jgi:hypothetical protein
LGQEFVNENEFKSIFNVIYFQGSPLILSPDNVSKSLFSSFDYEIQTNIQINLSQFTVMFKKEFIETPIIFIQLLLPTEEMYRMPSISLKKIQNIGFDAEIVEPIQRTDAQVAWDYYKGNFSISYLAIQKLSTIP